MIANKTAVIITGNPKYINNNTAKRFYAELKSFIESNGYKVEFDPGKEHTEPKKADLWIGHSRGADRLRFAPKDTKVIAIGCKGGINHPNDKAFEKGQIPDDNHFTLTNEMKSEILKQI